VLPALTAIRLPIASIAAFVGVDGLAVEATWTTEELDPA